MINYDIICFSHLRWNFVYQRPQHLMGLFALRSRIFFIEEPVLDMPFNECLIEKDKETNVYVVTPHVIGVPSYEASIDLQRSTLEALIRKAEIEQYVLWYYTPMALPFTDLLQPLAIVYDCMDELSAFRGAPPELIPLEVQLMEKADIVFTGGHSLYEAKKDRHPNIFPFPSSIDNNHFSQARTLTDDPADQINIPTPRLGFYGVIDERFNTQLVREMAALRPDFHYVFIGPIVKINADDLPQAQNIHYLGPKTYKELPAYLAQWDIAIMPFALNESTRYISPTKTPEFLSGGKPVISTPIRDVVTPYGDMGVVYIAETAEEFVAAANEIQRVKSVATLYNDWLQKVDSMLEGNSWTITWKAMEALIDKAVENNMYYVKADSHV